VLWLAWLETDVVTEGGFHGNGVKEYGYWLGIRAQKKVQGVVVSNGMRLLWDQSQKRIGGGQHGSDVYEEGEELRSDAVGAHEEAEEEVEALVGEVVQDISARKEAVIEWLSRHCIYCEVTGRYSGSDSHWHRNCKKS
jgi:hypothetical protein